MIDHLLSDAFEAGGKSFYQAKYNGHPITDQSFCKRSRLKYGTIMAWFVAEGISPGHPRTYSKSWSTALKSIQSIAEHAPGNISEHSCSDNGQWEVRCTKWPSCDYCRQNHSAHISIVAVARLRDLRGVCLKCFLAGGTEFLHSWYCALPGHSKCGSNQTSKAKA